MADEEPADRVPASAWEGAVGPRAAHIGDRLWSSLRFETITRCPGFLLLLLCVWVNESGQALHNGQTWPDWQSLLSPPPFAVHLADTVKIVELPNLFFVSLDERAAACSCPADSGEQGIPTRAIMRQGVQILLVRTLEQLSQLFPYSAPQLAAPRRKGGRVDLNEGTQAGVDVSEWHDRTSGQTAIDLAFRPTWNARGRAAHPVGGQALGK